MIDNARGCTSQPGGIARPGTLVLLLALFAPILAEVSAAERRQNFDTDPPSWIGHQNQLKVNFPPRIMQKFGWSPTTNFAGDAAGEIGGYIQATTRPAWYAKVIEPRTLEDRLEMSGSFALMEGRSIMGWTSAVNALFGFFNDAGQGFHGKNMLVLTLSGTNEPDGCLISVGYANQLASAGGLLLHRPGAHVPGLMRNVKKEDVIRIPPDGKRHRFKLTYDPAAKDGAGLISLDLDGQVWNTSIRKPHREQGAVFNRCGLVNMQLPGRAMVVYYDDIAINGERYDFSKDPGWEAHNNDENFEDTVLYGTQDFGYSPTTHCGGTTPGEIGGRIWRTDQPERHLAAWYADDIGKVTLEQRLEARAKLVIPRFDSDSGMHIGWFDSASQVWDDKQRVRNFVGVNLDSFGPGVHGRYLMPMYGTRRGGEILQPDQSTWFSYGPKVHDFRLVYDPNAATGRGAVTVTLDDQSATLPLREGARKEGAAMNRFGIFNMQKGNGKFCEVYLDELTYTAGDNAPAAESGHKPNR